MKHRQKKRRGKPESMVAFPRSSPDKSIPLTPEEFFFAMSLGSAAYSFRMPMQSPASRSLELRDEDDSVTELRFRDIPLNRMGFALAEHFEDRTKFDSFMYRFWALGRLRDDLRMAAYLKEEPASEQIGIHAAVLEAAAVLPLQADGNFEPDVFFQHVAGIIATGSYEDSPEDDHST
jgi:hypothetical protein